jgi:phosphohistidine phosphatase
VRLVLIRHAEAASGEPDELRALTPEGHEQARRLGEQLRADGIEPDAVLSSPLLRACETASDLGLGTPEPRDELGPGATVADVRAAVADRGETVVVVGHQPDCGEIVAELSGGPAPRFPPASFHRVDLDG